MDNVTLKIEISTRKKLPRDTSEIAELLAAHVEHIAQLCDQGFQAGQVIDDRFKGWWSIEPALDGRA